ncbi:MAG: DUF3796 domain-containing protein [Clostridia bacterium]|nr:DUF3796 domain-containing protein [Clostridia bacterium]
MSIKKINYLGFLSLLSLIGLLGWTTGHEGFYGYFGFLCYVRYFWVIPDELFWLNVRKAATIAFLGEMIFLVPLMYFYVFSHEVSEAIQLAFGSSFIVAVVIFTLLLVGLEWKERNDAD